MRFQGEAFYSVPCMVTGAALNTILTPPFVFPLGMGIAGSALATVVSEFASLLLLLVVMRRAGITPLGLRYVRPPGLAMLREIDNGGIPSFTRQIMRGVATSPLDNAAAPYGDAAIAGTAVVQRVTGMASYFQIGFGQGFQPIVGYSLGARKYGHIRQAFHTTVHASFLAVAAIGAVTFIFAPQLISPFRNDPDVVASGVVTLRVQGLTMPLTGGAMATNFMLQTAGKMWRATFLGACRLGLVLGAVVLVLPPLFGMLGVQLAQPVTDVVTTLIAPPIGAGAMQELRRRRYCQAPAEPRA